MDFDFKSMLSDAEKEIMEGSNTVAGHTCDIAGDGLQAVSDVLGWAAGQAQGAADVCHAKAKEFFAKVEAETVSAKEQANQATADKEDMVKKFNAEWLRATETVEKIQGEVIHIEQLIERARQLNAAAELTFLMRALTDAQHNLGIAKEQEEELHRQLLQAIAMQ